jgi:DNA-binding NarL/FixJ family response regulator
VIRVLVVDDQELVRDGFAVLLSLCDDIEVVGQAANGFEALSLATIERPDVVLMDIRMPEMDGLEATRRLAADPRTASCRVLILTTFDLDEYVFEALRVGASGFLLKDTKRDQLVEAVRVIARGDALLAPNVTKRLIAEFADQPALDSRQVRLLDSVTEREREVLLAVARGESNADIAMSLFMGAGTVKTHVSHLLTKIAVRDRAQLVMFAYESGLIRPGTAPTLANPPRTSH